MMTRRSSSFLESSIDLHIIYITYSRDSTLTRSMAYREYYPFPIAALRRDFSCRSKCNYQNQGKRDQMNNTEIPSAR